MLVLDGLADAWLEAGVKPWDLAPSKILIEEAGGRFSNFQGESSLELGNALVSNGLLHLEILSRIR
jgi:histidinol-phosphatase